MTSEMRSERREERFYMLPRLFVVSKRIVKKLGKV